MNPIKPVYQPHRHNGLLHNKVSSHPMGRYGPSALRACFINRGRSASCIVFLLIGASLMSYVLSQIRDASVDVLAARDANATNGGCKAGVQHVEEL